MQPEDATILRNFCVATMEGETKITRKVIAAIPEGKREYKPDPNSRSAFDLAWHLAHSDIFFLEGIANGQFASGEKKPDDVKTVADIVAWYDKKLPESLAKIKAMPADKLAQNLNFYDVFNQPAVTYLMFQNNHAIHHRGQLATYLRPMGSKCPGIYGGSFDEPFQAAAKA